MGDAEPSQEVFRLPLIVVLCESLKQDTNVCALFV
jgi:hypothetical protein